MRKHLSHIFILSGLVGCSTAAYVPPTLDTTHPANASALETPLPPPSETLAGDPEPSAAKPRLATADSHPGRSMEGITGMRGMGQMKETHGMHQKGGEEQ